MNKKLKAPGKQLVVRELCTLGAAEEKTLPLDI